MTTLEDESCSYPDGSFPKLQVSTRRVVCASNEPSEGDVRRCVHTRRIVINNGP